MLSCSAGCGIVSLLGTPTNYEKRIPAEYDLSEHADQKILVLVDQPGWLNAEVNLRYYLTRAISQGLVDNAGVLPEKVITYNELVEFRSNNPQFAQLAPTEVGKALNADIVLLVMVNGYQLSRIPQSGYYKGFLNTQAVLFESKSGKKLWPELEENKSVKVGFELEIGDIKAAAGRLAAASAYCTSRYFYNCRKNKFKISDDKINS